MTASPSSTPSSVLRPRIGAPAGVVELGYTPALGAGGESLGGSNPSARTYRRLVASSCGNCCTHPPERLDSTAVEASTVAIRHPNREKPQAQATKAGVVLLLLASAALIAIVLIGGWSLMAGAQLVAVAYVLIYLAMAYFVAVRWSRGVLPLAAGLSVIFVSMAAVAAPAWFARDKDGLAEAALPPGLLGLLTLVLIAVLVLLTIFAMRGFTQEWNVEVEVARDDAGNWHDTADYDQAHHDRPEQPGASGPATEYGGRGGEDEPGAGERPPDRPGPQP